MHRTLYTWRAADYSTTLYAESTATMEIFWVIYKGTDSEASGSVYIPASEVQQTIRDLEDAGYTVESIRPL